MNDPYADLLEAEAAKRTATHADRPYRQFSENYDLVGLVGEAEFARAFDQPMNWCLLAGGDGGIDFTVPWSTTVDVKCYRKPGNLIHETGKIKADIYVLAEFLEEERRALLLGWEWGRHLAQAPVRDFGYGVINHYIPRGELRPMSDLGRRIMRLVGGTR